MVNISEFQREYVKAMQDGTAAVFVGAGLSRPSGFVDWRGLLRELAHDIELDVDKEDDLISLAQYYANTRGGRGGVNQRILDCFSRGVSSNSSIDNLAKLPIETFWTTNYDTLLEDALRQVGKVVDVKTRPESLAVSKQDRDVAIYKMHGDVNDAAFCVITKDDYEAYNIHRQLFTTALQGDLVTKTFLFTGFSLDDPNINYILGKIRVLLGENARPHFWLSRKKRQSDYNNVDEYLYEQAKHQLRIRDLLRYGIQAVEVEEYSEIPKLFSCMCERVNRNKIFISGSAHTYGEKWEDHGISLIRDLSKYLIRNNYKVFTGHGRGVGSFVISSAVEESLHQKKHISKFLEIFAFPYEDTQRDDYDDLKIEYRNSIMNDVGTAIFIFGNKEINHGVINAPGVWEEYQIAKKQGRAIIPIGTTGYQAEKILNDLLSTRLPEYLVEHIEILRFSQNAGEIISCVGEVLKKINK